MILYLFSHPTSTPTPVKLLNKYCLNILNIHVALHFLIIFVTHSWLANHWKLRVVGREKVSGVSGGPALQEFVAKGVRPMWSSLLSLPSPRILHSDHSIHRPFPPCARVVCRRALAMARKRSLVRGLGPEKEVAAAAAAVKGGVLRTKETVLTPPPPPVHPSNTFQHISHLCINQCLR